MSSLNSLKKKIIFFKISFFSIVFFNIAGCSLTLKAQTTEPNSNEKVSTYEAEHEDLTYEDKHKRSKWFRNMNKPNADYFKIKKEYDSYFGNHRWETSKPRQLGESWFKTNIFYLDKKGIVQSPPAFDATKHQFKTQSTLNISSTTSIGSWSMLGPSNSFGAIYSSKYNKGGYVHLTRIDPTNPSKIFTSFQTGGLWMTTDGGTNWTLTDANLPDNPYYDLDVSKATPSTVYAISKDAVIKSTDGGLTYANTTLNSSGYAGQAYDIAVSPVDQNIVVARWADKVYRTIDGGTTWTTIVTGLPNYSIWEGLHSEMLDWSTTNNDVVYFLSTSSNNMIDLYRSADSGASFTKITTITLDPTANGQIIGWGKLFLPSNNSNEIYVAIGSGANTYAHHSVHLYKLNNTTGAVVGTPRINMIPGTGKDELHHGDITMDRTDEQKIVYGTYSQQSVHYSTDNGATFSFPDTEKAHSDFRTLDMINNKVAIGNDGEVTFSTDGGINYTNITNSISNHELWGFGSAFKSDLVAAGLNHGPVMIKEAGGGFDWYNGSGADQQNTDVNPLDDRYVYSRGYDNYRYFRTGVHTLINEANLLDLGNQNFFNNIEFHPNLYYTIITHHYGGFPTGNPNLAIWKKSLIRTDDNGISISIVKTFTEQVFREKICMTNPNAMYVVEGLLNNKLWKTTDGGANWTNVTPSSAESNGQTNISDIAVSDIDPNKIWVTYSGVQSSCKILKSTNGGTSYSNETDASLMGSQPINRIVFQRGSGDGVYICNKDGVYFKNTEAWSKLGGNDLPMMDIRFMFINYNLGKLRIGTSRGAWEHNLAETSPPKAQISADRKIVDCPNTDKVQFRDYSTVRNASATWAWSFPGGTPSSSTIENPLISYAGAADGQYNVVLTVTDAFGTDTQTLTNFIEVNGVGSGCAIDTVPGKLLTLSAPGDYAQQNSALGISSNTITLSCWIKPNGTQSNNAGLIFSGSNNATGMSYKGSNLLGYNWADGPGSYNFDSGLYIPTDVWSHVALVVTPTSATLYLNGIGSTRTATHAVVDFNSVFQFGIDRSNTSRNFKGLMDEVCIYNRALSADEIRELMNLTRNNPNAASLPQTDASLIGYYQINEGAGKPIFDKATGRHAVLVGGATKTDASTASVGGGTFQRINVTTGGLKDFDKPGVELTFPASGLYPDGDIVVSRLNVMSDQLPGAAILPNNPLSYYIIRNYGMNDEFDDLTSMKFKNVKTITNDLVTTPSKLKLYKRLSYAFGNTWGASIDNADVVTNNSGVGTIEFSTGLSVGSFSQFSIENGSPLPVELMSFNVKKINNKEALLEWNSASEVNFLRYDIEKSADGKSFEIIGTMPSRGPSKYTFNDFQPFAGNNYYRLKMIDLDGGYKYSELKNLAFDYRLKFQLYPNPSPNGEVSFSFQGLESSTDLSLSVTNSRGELVKSLFLSNIENNKQYMTKVSDTPGIYFIKVALANGQVFVEKLIIDKKH